MLDLTRQFSAFRHGVTHRVSRNGVLSLSASIVTIAAYFVLMRGVAISIGLAALGLWSLVSGLVGLVRMLDLGGMANLARVVATHSEDSELQCSYIDSAAIFGGAFFISVAMIAYFPIQWIVLNSIEKADAANATRLLVGLLATVPLNMVGLMHLGALDGIGRADIRSIITIAATTLYAISGYALIGHYETFGLVIAQLLQFIFIIVCARMALSFKVINLRAFPRNPELKIATTMISYGARLQISSIPMAVFDPLCRVFVGRYAGLEQLGIYELSYKFSSTVRTILNAALSPIMPEFARLMSRSFDEAKAQYDRVQTINCIVTPVLTLLQIGFLPIASIILIGSPNSDFVLVGGWLSLAWGLSSLGLVPHIFARAAGVLRWSILGQWLLLVSGFFILLSAGSLADSVYLLACPAIAIVLGHLIALAGESSQFHLSVISKKSPLIGIVSISALCILSVALIANSRVQIAFWQSTLTAIGIS